MDNVLHPVRDCQPCKEVTDFYPRGGEKQIENKLDLTQLKRTGTSKKKCMITTFQLYLDKSLLLKRGTQKVLRNVCLVLNGIQCNQK